MNLRMLDGDLKKTLLQIVEVVSTRSFKDIASMPQILFKDFTRDQSWRDMAEKTDQGENMQTI